MRENQPVYPADNLHTCPRRNERPYSLEQTPDRLRSTELSQALKSRLPAVEQIPNIERVPDIVIAQQHQF